MFNLANMKIPSKSMPIKPQSIQRMHAFYECMSNELKHWFICKMRSEFLEYKNVYKREIVHCILQRKTILYILYAAFNIQ